MEVDNNLCAAAEAGDVDEVTRLVEEEGGNINYVNKFGFTPLTCLLYSTCIRLGYPSAIHPLAAQETQRKVRVFMRLGASLSPLFLGKPVAQHIMTLWPDAAFVAAVRQHDHSWYRHAEYGTYRTALFELAVHGDEGALRAAGVPPEEWLRKASDGRTPLHDLAAVGSVRPEDDVRAVATYLLNTCPGLKMAKDGKGATPYEVAVQSNNDVVANVLLRHTGI